MSKWDNFKRHLLYGDVSKGTYKEILPLITEENNKMMDGLVLITTFFGWILTALSCFGILSRKPLPAYVFLLATSVIFTVARKTNNFKNSRVSHFFALSQCLSLVIFGLLNSTVFSPNSASNGTIFLVLLLIQPFLLISVPLEMDSICIVLTIIYCILVYKTKIPSVRYLDYANAISVCIIACLCNWIFTTKSIQNLLNKFYIIKERDTDELTGLLSKQAGKTLVKSNINRHVGGTLFIIDMDNFKKINDEFGHLYGDEILIKLSNGIKENTRRIDVASRFGGDEFVIFFPQLDGEDIEIKAKNIYSSFNKIFQNEKTPISCSIGIATAKETDTYKTLFKRADDSLYKAKEAGKKRYIIN